jgi:hypothetical protein
LNDKETKALIATHADLPEAQLKAPIVFTLKGLAKVPKLSTLNLKS